MWRLAYLLIGGDERAAAGLVFTIVDRQPNLRFLDAAHLDRMVVLAARERRVRSAAPAKFPDAASEAQRRAFEAASAMPPQLLEAWVLTRVDGLGDLHVSRAMDCSKTASARHLAAAEEHMAAATAMKPSEAADAVRALVDGLDAGPSLERCRTEKRKRRRAKLLAVAAAALAAVVVVVKIVL